jgi:hypothetical protein
MVSKFWFLFIAHTLRHFDFAQYKLGFGRALFRRRLVQGSRYT